MNIIELVQGSESWHKHRATHLGASEAAAMLGLSKYVTRSELLRQKATGLCKDVDSNTQAIFNRGHETEALARPFIETMIGEELWPVTCESGNLSCSCDGLTLDNDIAWEHKQDSNALFSSVATGKMPEEHLPQCQQILMITGASKLIFTVSNGTPERMASLEVYPDPAWFERIKAGWVQFMLDLENYRHIEHAEKPQAEAIMQLPALSVQATGMVTHSNLPEFKAAAESYIANINTDLQTDQQFADAEATVKFCKTTEETLEVTKKAILAQTSTIDEVIRTVDHIQAQLRDKRLMLDKLVKSEKEARRHKMVSDTNALFTAHLADLQAEIAGIRLDVPSPRFVDVIKGLKSLSSMHDALDTALANAKIEADAVAKDVRAKLAWLKHYDSLKFLFADLQQIISKPLDDFQLVIMKRVDAHNEAEAERKAAHEAEAARKLEAQRAAIQAEEERKATAKAQAAAEAIVAAERAKQAKEEAKARAKVEVEQPAPLTVPQSAPQAKPDNVVVIEHQDVISAFMSSRDFGRDAGKVRAILVEFVKFSEHFGRKEAA